MTLRSKNFRDVALNLVSRLSALIDTVDEEQRATSHHRLPQEGVELGPPGLRA